MMLKWLAIALALSTAQAATVTSSPVPLASTSPTRDAAAPERFPYAINAPRPTLPPYCIGFNITYPAVAGETYKRGQLQTIEWSVDRSIPNPPDLITRIRIFDKDFRNEQVLGENITIYTHKTGGSLTYFVDANDIETEYHYRIMVNYPGQSVHCIFMSKPFTITPYPYIRYLASDTPAPAFAIPQTQ
ncbi:hypothetical protein CLU79DRAFT_738514 [Phycomyces nitens]|nr:hypothetical protein CLU79DRAFT_738514 [Phycomyces nitens]